MRAPNPRANEPPPTSGHLPTRQTRSRHLSHRGGLLWSPVVQLDGKSAVAVVYYQRIKGGGTAKPSVQALFRWLDPADGKPISEAMVDVTPLLGDNEVNSNLPGGFTKLAVDTATGQVAVGVAPTSLIGAKSGVITVIADQGWPSKSAMFCDAMAGACSNAVR